MAHVVPNAIFSEVAGKLGDQIFQRNRGGPFVRSLVVAVQPNTPSQLASRADMATAVASWQNLSDADRTKWIDFALDINAKSKARLGGRMSGYNLYLARKLTLLKIGSSSTPYPIYPINPPFGTISISQFSVNSLWLDVNVTQSNPFGSFIIDASPMSSPGIMSVNSVRFSRLITRGATGSSSGSILSQYLALYGYPSLSIGQKIFFRSRSIEQFALIGKPINESGIGILSRTYDYAVCTLTA